MMRFPKSRKSLLMCVFTCLLIGIGCRPEPDQRDDWRLSDTAGDRAEGGDVARQDSQTGDAGRLDTSGDPTDDASLEITDAGPDSAGGGPDAGDGGSNRATRATAWTKLLDKRANDTFTDVATDTSGNVYVVGAVTGAVGEHTYGGGESDALVAKYAPDGTRKWARLLGSGGDDRAVAVDMKTNDPNTSGPLYVAWNRYLNNDDHLLKAHVTRLPLDGSAGKTRQLTNPTKPLSFPVLARDIAANTLHGIRLVGSANDRAFGKPDDGHAGAHDDAFAATFDEALTTRKSIAFRSRGGAWDAGVAIAGPRIDDASRWLVVHGGGPTAYGNPDSPTSATVVRDTNSGGVRPGHLWSFDIGYLRGSPRTVVAVGTTGGQHPDAFVAGFTSGGEERFQTTIGGDGPDFATGVGETDGKHLWVTGATGFTRDEAGDAPARGYLARFDADGTRQHTIEFGKGAGDTVSRGLATGPDGAIYVVGSTSGTVDGKPANGATAHSAGFVTKWTEQSADRAASCTITFDESCPNQGSVCDVRFEHGNGCQPRDDYQCPAYGRAYVTPGDRPVEITFERPVRRVDIALWNHGEPPAPPVFRDAEGRELDVGIDKMVYSKCPDDPEGLSIARFERPAVSATFPARGQGATLIDEMTVYYANP
ncbi:MAG: hypothetical protein ABEN55_09695 [Bradymonadaceae bacterium]